MQASWHKPLKNSLPEVIDILCFLEEIAGECEETTDTSHPVSTKNIA
jgi:hypothetical protein